MEILDTQDGSTTILSSTFNVTYHSRFGAIQESQHVFIKNGLLPILQDSPPQINILEIGFGTGLNFLLTHLISSSKKKPIFYTTIDLVPLSQSIINKINFVQQLKLGSEYSKLFHLIHELSWDKKHIIDEFTEFLKEKKDLIDYQIATEFYDLVYFDAFAPTAQPELWENTILEKVYNSLKPCGSLVTYCAKGSVKRIFKNLGGTVESLAGPPGKREMIRIIRN